MTLPILTAEEQRVLGCLLEKEITVPASYPLTLNALRAACNQSSSRDPQVDYDERTVQDAARALKNRGLARVTWMDYGRRTLKYAHQLDEGLPLEPDERALLTVLLLRGPQAPGELKTRTERLHRFAGRDAVEATLARMAGREAPLVRRLERKPGQQDHRWIHVLGEPPSDAAEAVVDREQVLGEGADARDAAALAAYAGLAAAAPEPVSLLPFEEWFLTRVAELAGPHRLADVGCGLGDVTLVLAEAGADPTGFDIVPEIVAAARERNEGIEFETADLRTLLRPATASGWGGINAWFSLNHLAPSELADALRHLTSTLLPGGVLGAAVWVGNIVEPVTAWQGVSLPVACVHHDAAEVFKAAVAAGLVEVETYRVAAPGRGEALYLAGRRA